jgi:hypothetical protein
MRRCEWVWLLVGETEERFGFTERAGALYLHVGHFGDGYFC